MPWYPWALTLCECFSVHFHFFAIVPNISTKCSVFFESKTSFGPISGVEEERQVPTFQQ